MAFAHMTLAGGYTPSGFLVATITGRAQWKPGNGPFTFNFSRDPVKDTQLSYAGLRDPSGNTLGNLGQIWGAVVANQGTVQFSRARCHVRLLSWRRRPISRGLQGRNNTRIAGTGGAYWRLLTSPENGNLSIGVNFFGMHYANNQDAFTHGMGGYFSPQAYFLANVPFTWAGHYGTKWHYNIFGSAGVQAFQADATPLWPMAVDKALETAMNNAMLPAKTSVGPNYDLRGPGSLPDRPALVCRRLLRRQQLPQLLVRRDRFLCALPLRSQPSTVAGPTGIFPTDGVRPFTVP